MDSKIMSGIVSRIKSRRQELNLSYQDLAHRAGMSKSTLQRYEAGGIKNLPLDKLPAIAAALEVSQQYIMGWDNNNKPLAQDEGPEWIEAFMSLSADSKALVAERVHALSELEKKSKE